MTKNNYTYISLLFFIIAAMVLGFTPLNNGPHPISAQKAGSRLDVFSGERAFEHLSDLLSENKPHPSGSAENLRIRKLIEAKFTSFGYDVEIQPGLGCTLHYPGCTQIENILVHIPGTGNGDIIMLTAHYDSVPAGAAAADDGAGTAAMIEIARMIQNAPPVKNDILFLITDGEEGGLRGAKAFADSHPLMKRVKLIINLESRGGSGASTMFETSNGNLKLIRTYAKTAKHPIANSFSYEVYKRLPNDTDYSIYKPFNIAGLNYAFTGDVARYHSRRDDLENLSKASLQHHGTNMLAALHAFENTDLSNLVGGADATYFDIFGQFIIHWPTGFNLPLSLLTLVIVGFSIVRTRPGFKALGGAFLVSVLLLILTPLLGWVLSFPLGRWPQLFYLDHPYPWPGRMALLGAGLLAPVMLVTLAHKWLKSVDYNALTLSAALLFSLGSLALSLVIPGAAYVLLVPALAICTGLIWAMIRKTDHFGFAVHAAFFAAAYMAMYTFLVLDVIASYRESALRVLPLVILGLVFLPILKGKSPDKVTTPRHFGLRLAVVTLIFTAISAFLPGFNERHPRGQNIIYIQDSDTQTAHWVSAGIVGQDQEFLDAAGFNKDDNFKIPYGMAYGNKVAKPAPFQNISGVNHTIIANTVTNGVRNVVMEVTSTHGGFEIGIAFDRSAAPDTIKINGQLAADYTQKPYRDQFTIRGPKTDTFRVELSGKADIFTSVALIDTYSLLPKDTAGMDALRPTNSAPLHGGDRAHIMKTVSLQ
jgi:hypothetical protein